VNEVRVWFKIPGDNQPVHSEGMLIND